jgi:hypothetical protein
MADKRARRRTRSGKKSTTAAPTTVMPQANVRINGPEARIRPAKSAVKAAGKDTAPAREKAPAPPKRGSVTDTLREIFLQRSESVLKQLAQQADSTALKRALAAPSDIGGVATFLSDLLGSTVEVSAVDPLAAAIARGTKVKEELLERAGGAYTSTQVADFLNISRQAVDKRRQHDALLAVPTGTGDYRYPKAQFAASGPLPGLERVLRAFTVTNPWTRLAVLLEPADTLGGETMLGVLLAGNVEAATALARAVGEQLA